MASAGSALGLVLLGAAAFGLVLVFCPRRLPRSYRIDERGGLKPSKLATASQGPVRHFVPRTPGEKPGGKKKAAAAAAAGGGPPPSTGGAFDDEDEYDTFMEMDELDEDLEYLDDDDEANMVDETPTMRLRQLDGRPAPRAAKPAELGGEAPSPGHAKGMASKFAEKGQAAWTASGGLFGDAGMDIPMLRGFVRRSDGSSIVDKDPKRRGFCCSPLCLCLLLLLLVAVGMPLPFLLSADDSAQLVELMPVPALAALAEAFLIASPSPPPAPPAPSAGAARVFAASSEPEAAASTPSDAYSTAR